MVVPAKAGAQPIHGHCGLLLLSRDGGLDSCPCLLGGNDLSQVMTQSAQTK